MYLIVSYIEHMSCAAVILTEFVFSRRASLFQVSPKELRRGSFELTPETELETLPTVLDTPSREER